MVVSGCQPLPPHRQVALDRRRKPTLKGRDHLNGALHPADFGPEVVARAARPLRTLMAHSGHSEETGYHVGLAY
jgi:hypothetical protein